MINYPIVNAGTASQETGIAPRFSPESIIMSLAGTYTASYGSSVTCYIIETAETGGTMKIQVPTSSLAATINGIYTSRYMEFWRIDATAATIKLVSQTGSVVFGGVVSSSTELILPSSSYTALAQLDAGDNTYFYFILKRNPLGVVY